MTKPKVVFHPFSEEFFNNPFEIYDECVKTRRSTTTRKRTSMR